MKICNIAFFKALIVLGTHALFCAESEPTIEQQESDLVPTFICGGSGGRLWPISREDEPKILMRPDDQSFLQRTYIRGTSLQGVSNILTVTNQGIFFRVQKEYEEVANPFQSLKQHFILEPCARNTGPAIAAACLYAQQHISENAILLILAADHVVLNYEAFSQAVSNAVDLAKSGKIVTFGITPRSPETGYGYIEYDGTNVLRFVEKPNLETAQAYVDSGRFLWNSGMFCFKAKDMIEEMKQLCPAILEKTNEAVEKAALTHLSSFSKLTIHSFDFEQVPSDSIDYAVMEKSSNVGVIPCDIGWSDIGCWRSLSELLPTDENGNHFFGDVIARNTEDCTVISRNRVVGAIGVRGLAIVDTPDALLVVNKQSAQDVKSIVSTLKKRNHSAYKTHQTTIRPWGSFTILGEGPGFKVKSITVNPGEKLSLQSHQHRSEHWTVVSGIARVLNGDQELTLERDGSTFIPATYKHRLENIGSDLLTLIETQTGSYLGEDDITRYEDIYGRA